MSTQVNIRLNEHLLQEIDAITKVLHVSRSEWLRNIIAHAVKEETLNLREAIALEYAKGHISEEELNVLLGPESEDVKFIVKHLKEGEEKIDRLVEK
ncbi:MAG: ribbon-helix-helix protein, CopG family [Thermoplasmatota archaeon]